MVTVLTALIASYELPLQNPSGGSLKLERTYKVGDDNAYTFSVTPDEAPGKIQFKIREKTLALLDGGKATLELSVTMDAKAENEPTPEKVSWTFGKDGLAEANVNFNSPTAIYSIFSFLSVVPGSVTPGSEFKIAWVSPDKAASLRRA
jgi:hypothetical protein